MNTLKTYKEFNIYEAKVIRRNLPINTTYTLIDSYYTGGLMNNPQICDNCGKGIANVGVIQNKNGETFNVGMDCASTLSGIKDSLDYNESMNNFNEAQAIRAKIRNNQKKYPTYELFVNTNAMGDVIIKLAENKDKWHVMSISHPYTFVKKYLPEIEKLITNKDKIGYTPKYTMSDDFGFNFNKITQPRQNGNDYSLKIDDYDIVIKDTILESDSGKKNDIIDITISKNGKIIKKEQTYMPRDVKNYIVYALNTIEFENY
jgi:hypothetical protein